MSYQVLARKWRPNDFGEMVGQKHVLQTLTSALEKQRLHHAYLFTGTRGVGKTTLARILARCLNCDTGITATPCGECSSCTEITEGRFVDLIEVDAASKTKVDDTRELLDNVQYRPTRGRYKIYLIDEVHMLSKHSFNALLKTLEEPPEHVIFLLATTDPQMLPPTVLSRCLQFHLKNMTMEEIRSHLEHILTEEKVTFEDKALSALAWSAKGSMRDALSLLDQAIAYGNGKVLETEVKDMLGSIDRDQIVAIIKQIASQDAASLLATIEDMDQYAPNYSSVLDELIDTLHRLALEQWVPGTQIDETLTETYQSLSSHVDVQDIQLFYQIALMAKRDLYLAPNPRSGLEMCVLRMMSFLPGSPGSGGQTQVKKSESSPTQTSNKQSEQTVTPSNSENIEQEQPQAIATKEHHADIPEVDIPDASPADYDDTLIPPDMEVSLPPEVVDPPVTSTEPQKPAETKPAQETSSQVWDINSILTPRTESPEIKTEAKSNTEPEPKPEPEPEITAREPADKVIQKTTISTASTETVNASQPISDELPDADTTKIALESVNKENWYQVVAALDIVGIGRQIFLASQVASMSNETLTLDLLPEMWNTVSPEQINRMSLALHDYFSEEFRLHINETAPDAETPGQRLARIKVERHQAACESLLADSNVQSLQKNFDANLDLDSVEPISN